MRNLHTVAEVSFVEEGLFDLSSYDSETHPSRANKKAGELREQELMLEHPFYFRQVRQ